MGKHVLIIDPAQTVRAVLHVCFEDAGHRVCCFADYGAALDALPALRDMPPDLAFVTMQQPWSGSVRLLQSLKQLSGQMVVIAVFAQEDKTDRLPWHLLRETCALTLTKPFLVQDALALCAFPPLRQTTCSILVDI